MARESVSGFFDDVDNIEDLVMGIYVGITLNAFDDDSAWLKFGYPKRPRIGAMRRKLLPNALTELIEEELLTFGFIDTFNTIKQFSLPDIKIALALGVIDRHIQLTQDVRFPITDVFVSYAGLVDIGIQNPVSLFANRARDTLSPENLRRFMEGSMELCTHATPPFTDGIVMETAKCAKDIGEVSLKGDPRPIIYMEEEHRDHYEMLLSKYVFDIEEG